MLKDFAKLQTFLMLIKEKSFSRAAAKLGISQPAVTQQIKFIEDYLDTKVVQRKKNGILLTKEGEDFFRIAQKLDKAIKSSEKELLKIIHKNFTFVMGASFTIGNYILPNYLGAIKKKINHEVFLNVELSCEITQQLEDKKIDIALIESPQFKENIIYREWLDDELVIFSNQQLPKQLQHDDLMSYDWVCREENSHTKILTSDAFEEVGIPCDNFSVLGVLTSPTAIKSTILHADKNTTKPLASVISRHIIKDEVKDGKLFQARIKDRKIERKFYIAYLKERKHEAFIDNVVNYLLTITKV